jgi:hypothetical protein
MALPRRRTAKADLRRLGNELGSEPGLHIQHEEVVMIRRARLLPVGILVAVAVALSLGAMAQGSPSLFEDAFTRPDGGVDNGWTTWWGTMSPADSDIQIINNELVTKGSYGNAGGVFRPLPVTYPLTFSFDFRTTITADQSQCSSTGRNESAWVIAFNFARADGPVYPQVSDASQLMFAYNNPLNYVARLHRSPENTRVEERGTPVQARPTPGEVRAWPPMHVDGLVRADGSATLELYFNDQQTPDPVVYEFDSIPGGMQAPPGSYLALGNGSCNTGAQIFDNLIVRTARPGPPSSKAECKHGGWELFTPPYRNQGQCIFAVNQARK